MYKIVESIRDIKELLDSNEEVYFFGNGKISNLIWEELDDSYKDKIKGIIVTDISGKEFHGKPIYSMDDNCWRNGQVLLTVGCVSRNGIKIRLEERGYKNYIDISRRLEDILQDWDPEKRQEEEISRMIWRVTPHPIMESIVINIVDHCNLNCKGCDHFSSIAKERFVTVERLERDFKELRRLMKDSIKEFWVMGGEPLLHPEVAKILRMNREIFPNNRIVILTNGLLLPKQSEEFWTTCRDYRIDIEMTKYPVNFDYGKVEELARKYDVNYEYFAGGETVKTLYHFPLDLSGDRDPAMTFINCDRVQGCNMLSEGKVYPCPIAPNMHCFNEKFGTNIELGETDGVELEACKDKDEFITKLCKPMEVCRYCNVEGRIHGDKWCVSKGSIEEWT